MRLLTVISLILFGFAVHAEAQDRPYQLVCFEEDGIVESLNKVVNAQQFLQNDRLLQSGSCSFAQVPSGSTARYVGLHASVQGFLYPIYRVSYATTGQRMYAADGVFRMDQWKVRRDRDTGVRFLTPKSCDVLDGYIQLTNRVPQYMFVPEICEVQVIE